LAADALRARAETAGAWPDPMVSVELSNTPLSSFGLTHPMSGVQVGVAQTLRPPQWSARAREPIQAASRAATLAGDEAANQLRAGVGRAWWRLTRSRLLEHATAAQLARTEELKEAVVGRYEVGAVGQSAVLRLEVLRARLSDELGSFKVEEVRWLATLQQAAGGPVDPDTPAHIEPLTPRFPAWLEQAQEGRPALARLDARAEAADATALAARAEAMVDPTVRVGYRVRAATATDPGDDMVSVGLSLPIPTGSGRRAHGAEDAARAQAASVRQERRAAEDAIAATGTTLAARWQRAHDKATAYQNVLLPAAEAALSTSQSDFAVGKADFSTLFDAEVVLLDLERSRIEAAIQTHLLAEDAAALVGAPAAP
jgi:cobalt-zinc-cadmium efflux system outer membrane protein